MRKEVIFAVIFGVIIGGVILYGINLANSSSNSIKETSTPTASPSGTSISPTPTIKTVTTNLNIQSPENNTVIFENKTTLKGNTSADTAIAIVSELDDILIKSSPEGTFSAEINLIKGTNEISISTPNKQGVLSTITLHVIYSDKNFE